MPALHFFRPALAVSLVAVLLTVAMARPSEARGAAGTLSISDMSMCEGNSGSTTFSVTAKLTGTTGPFTFLWVTGGGGTSDSTSDYTPTALTSTMTGADGETATFDIQVNGDTDVEPDETFFVYISDVAGGGELPTYGVSMATATILDDDGSACGGGGDIPTISFNDVRSAEGDSGAKNFSFTATLSGATDAFTVKADTYRLGSASGNDFIEASKTLSFAGTTGERKTFDVAVLGDTKAELDETFFVGLSNVQGLGVKPLILPSRGLGTIVNDDEDVKFTVSPTTAKIPSKGKIQRFRVRAADDLVWRATVVSSSYRKWIRKRKVAGKGPGRSIFKVLRNTGKPRTGRILFKTYPVDGSPNKRVTVKVRQKGANNRAVFTLMESPPGFRDFDGDGLEEVGLTAPETGGEARATGVQLFNVRGERLHLLSGGRYSALQSIAMDTNGDANAGAVFLGTEESGAAELQVRDSSGTMQVQERVSEAGSYASLLRPFEFDGRRGHEIGIGRGAEDGTGHFAVWGRAQGTRSLQLLAEHTVIEADSDLHEWLPVDVDGDGRDEIAATYTAPSGKGALLRVVDPRSGEMLVDKRILKARFDEAVWAVGSFDPDDTGEELLVGYRRRSDASAHFKVLSADGRELSEGSVAGTTVVESWKALRAAPGPQGTARDLVFVGFTRSNGEGAFEVWDPSIENATRVGGGTVAGDEYEVLSWQVEDFDGTPDNGWEIAVVTRSVDDGSIGFRLFDRDGTALGSRVQVFDGNHTDVSASPVVFERKGRGDLVLLAHTVDGDPVVQVWNVNAGVLIKKISVLSKDVE